MAEIASRPLCKRNELKKIRKQKEWRSPPDATPTTTIPGTKEKSEFYISLLPKTVY